MRSLRSQLVLGTALATAAVLLLSGVGLYALMSRALWTEFDASLAARARSLAVLVEQEGDRLEFEFDEASPPEFEPGERAEVYQIRLADGSVFSSSPSLLNADLDRIAGPSEVPAFKTVYLPDGRPGRIVGLTFIPRQEDEHRSGHPLIEVTLVVGRDTLDLQAALVRVRGILIGVGLLAVAFSAGVLAWVVGRSLRPVDRLSGRIAELGENDWSARLELFGVPPELVPVVDRLNELLSRLGAAFERERRFTGDVAHELRTPLAGLRTKLELALSRDRDPEAYRKTLDDCLQIDLHLQGMVETLLHLARADAGQLEVRSERIVLSKVLRECWEPLQEKAAARTLNVAWRLDDPGLIESDPDKVQLVVRNVLENAVGHADDRGTICIATCAAEGALTLTVSNTGSRLSTDQVGHVFDRFWRGDASFRGAPDHHCGLGLPLCKTIVERLDGAIEATINAEGTFSIAIRLPKTA